MTDCKDIKICSLELLKRIKHYKRVNKADEEKIINIMNIYLDKLIFNITALCALLCFFSLAYVFRWAGAHTCITKDQCQVDLK